MTEVRECPELLVEFTTATRLDWTPEEVEAAITACRTAGYGWGRIARGLVDLALQDEPVPTKPRDLWAARRGLGSRAGAGSPLDPGVKALALAAAEAHTQAIRALEGKPPIEARWTGPQEALREAHDP